MTLSLSIGVSYVCLSHDKSFAQKKRSHDKSFGEPI